MSTLSASTQLFVCPLPPQVVLHHTMTVADTMDAQGGGGSSSGSGGGGGAVPTDSDEYATSLSLFLFWIGTKVGCCQKAALGPPQCPQRGAVLEYYR